MGKEKVLGYKIRHGKTGLYLSSISNNKWTKIGKTWPRKGDVTRAINSGLKSLNRLRRYNKMKYENILDDIPNWEVIELTESSKFPVLFMLDKLKVGQSV